LFACLLVCICLFACLLVLVCLFACSSLSTLTCVGGTRFWILMRSLEALCLSFTKLRQRSLQVPEMRLILPLQDSDPHI
jgi:uncharacterized membrane protein YgdD (TMEM256/DUF423 family)